MKRQFIVQESDKIKREEFYDYINETYNLNNWYPFKKESFVNSNFPFVVDFKEKSFWICDSITCCACAASTNSIINIDEFKNLISINENI